VFSRVTIGFGLAVIAVSGLATVVRATTTGLVTIPVLFGVFFVVLGWLGGRIVPDRPVRQWSPSRFPTIVAAALVLSSAPGTINMVDAIRTGTSPSASDVFQSGLVVAGVGYIIFGAWTDIAEARRVARARAAALAAAAPPRGRSGRTRAGRARH